MQSNPETCPSCFADLRGDLIFDVGLKMHNGDRDEALKFAECFGASETEGCFGKVIGIYDFDRDRTVAWHCPECDYEWPR